MVVNGPEQIKSENTDIKSTSSSKETNVIDWLNHVYGYIYRKSFYLLLL